MIEQYKTKRLSDTYLPGKPKQRQVDDKDGETEKRAAVTKSTITRELSFLSSIVTWMTKPEINLAAPMNFKIKGWSQKHIKAPLPKIIQRDDVIRIARNAERAYRGIFLVCYYGGLRRSEILRLKAEDVHLGQGI